MRADANSAWRLCAGEAPHGTKRILIPLYHCFCAGILRTLFKAFFPKTVGPVAGRKKYVLDHQMREIISKRCASVVVPNDCVRGSEDIKYYKSWTMEQLGFCIGSTAPFLFDKAWSHDNSDPWYRMIVLLHRAYHIYFDSIHERRPGQVDEAHACLFEFAKLAELHLPHNINTYNVHVASEHLREEEGESGSVSVTNELWIERLIRAFVVATRGGRITKDVGAFLMNEKFVRATAALWRPKLEDAGLSVAALKARSVPVAAAQRGFRDEVIANGNYFSSRGTAICFATDAGRLVEQLLLDYFVEMPEHKIDPSSAAAGSLQAWQFTTAVKQGLELHSSAYTLVRTRCSWHFEAKFATGQGAATTSHYGKALRFLLVKAIDTDGSARTFRFAEVQLYHQRGRPTPARPWGVVDTTNPYTGYPRARKYVTDRLLLLESIERKVVFCHRDATYTFALPFLIN